MQSVILPYNYLIAAKNIRIYVQHNHIITIFGDYGTNQKR